MKMGLRAVWRRALGAFPGEAQQAVFARAQLLALGFSFLAGFLLTWILSGSLETGSGAGRQTASPAAVASSYVLSLSLLCVCLAFLRRDDREGRLYWRHLCAWFRVVDLTILAFLGVWLAPGSGISLVAALVLTAVTCAYAAALCGLHALLCTVVGGTSKWIHAALTVVLVLTITALLWTQAPLQALQRERAVSCYETGTQAVAVLSPTMGLSAFWNADPTGFNLTKTTHTYQLWLGPSFIRFPRLWPGRSGLTEDDRGPFGPGLILGLACWGLALIITGDLAGSVRQKFLPRDAAHLGPDRGASEEHIGTETCDERVTRSSGQEAQVPR